MRTTSVFLLLHLTGLAVHAQMNQCARDCVVDWCQPICGDNLRCRGPCMDDCEDSCVRCEMHHNCPDDLLDYSPIVLSKVSGTTEKDLWVTGTKETSSNDESGVEKAAVVPTFERLNDALWRGHQEGRVAGDTRKVVAKTHANRGHRQRAA
ncbi:hypothetical protein QBC41DRAFT_112449 [Cercophora samala]|uniref:Uncharacterized protein n=1 Tax=Cercophora samala TaxID=330535 RepID=A0AA39ZDQ0_9PEZI|nr:hypothetical protein QBC41DRAFT_112449 [Cercophora samala]